MKVFKLTLKSLPLLILTACGSIMGPGPLTAPNQTRYAPATDSTNGGTQPSGGTSGSYSCPGSPNVLPRNFAGSDGNFTVCKNNQNPKTQVLIKGSTTSYYDHSEICLFVAQQNSSYSPISWIKDSSRNQPLYRCGTLNDNQIQISIPALPSTLTWNTAVIISSSDINQMLSCIYYGNSALCPKYSLGVVQ